MKIIEFGFAPDILKGEIEMCMQSAFADITAL